MAPEPRLAAHIWVSAYLARLQLANIPAYILRHGDNTAGSALVKVSRLDNTASLWCRIWDYETDTRKWDCISDGPEVDVDKVIKREALFDPDIWVIEIESRDGRSLLDEDGLT